MNITQLSSSASFDNGEVRDVIDTVIQLIQRSEIPSAKRLLQSVARSAEPIRDLQLLIGVCASSITYKLVALDAAERELANFPDSIRATQLRTLCLTAREEKRVVAKPGVPKVSLITTYRSHEDSFEPLLRALVWQHHEPFELVVVVRHETCMGDAERLLARDPRVKIVQAYGASMVQALSKGFAVASGDVQGMILSPNVILSDTGLAKMLEVFKQVPQVSFLTSERNGVDELGLPFPLRNPLPSWSQQLVLDPDNGNYPALKIPTHATLWRASLMEKCGGRLDETLSEAYDYELFTRFLEHTELFTATTSVAACGDELTAKSDSVSKLYREELHSVSERYRNRSAFVARDTVPQKIGFSDGAPTPRVETVIPRARQYPAAPQIHVPRKVKVTVVTPSFNQAEYIGKTIDSILSQKGVDLEYIIMDGGSTDGSVDIIKRHERFLSNWVSGRDGGQYHAIQAGLNRSTGDVMTWLNSDDVFVPDALALVSEVFAYRPDIRWLTGRVGAINPRDELALSTVVYTYSGSTYLNGDFDDPWIQQEGTFWRRDLWNDAGAALDLSWSLAADLELWTRFFRLTSLVSVDSPIALYREHDQRRSVRNHARYLREAHRIIQREQKLLATGLIPRPPAAPPMISF